MSHAFKKLGGVEGLVRTGLALSTGGLSEVGYAAYKGLTKVPKVRKPAPVVPLPDEMEVMRKRRNAEARKRRKGRASTVLSDYGYDVGL